MRFTPRLLPVLIAAAAILLSTKLVDLWLAIGLAPAPPANAQTNAPAAKPEPAAPAPAQASATPAQTTPAQTIPAQTPAASPAAESPAAPATKMAARDPSLFTPQEVDVLQSLARRRAELDKRAGEVDQQAALLQAAEQRINEKIAKLQEMQKTIDASFKKEDQADDAKLKSLVKIYETMKPRDAARIFEQLDLPVLLDVMERMKERNTAPIMAAMDPAKAKAVTLALAARRPAPQVGE